MLDDREVSAAIGSTAYDTDGNRIGTVEHFFVDDRTGAPTWVALTTGLFGTRQSVVPATGAAFTDGTLRLPVGKEAVTSAPEVPDPAHLDASVEDRLRRHYGLSPADAAGLAPDAQPPAAHPSAAPAPGWSPTQTGTVPVGAVGTPGSEPPGPVPVSDEEVAAARAPEEPGEGSMVRSEERLRVTTERVPVGRVRLVKYVVTEEVQVTVPIRREEVRLEEVPLGDEHPTAVIGEALVPPGGHTGGGLPDEIVLHAERPVVTVEVVPVERVRVRTEVVTGQEQVSERLQREQIVLDQS